MSSVTLSSLLPQINLPSFKQMQTFAVIAIPIIFAIGVTASKDPSTDPCIKDCTEENVINTVIYCATRCGVLLA